MTHTLLIDIHQPNLLHTRLDCVEHDGFLEFIEGQLADDAWSGDLDEIEAAAFRAGLLVPAELADDRSRACPCCTLVAAPYWRAAA